MNPFENETILIWVDKIDEEILEHYCTSLVHSSRLLAADSHSEYYSIRNFESNASEVRSLDIVIQLQ